MTTKFHFKRPPQAKVSQKLTASEQKDALREYSSFSLKPQTVRTTRKCSVGRRANLPPHCPGDIGVTNTHCPAEKGNGMIKQCSLPSFHSSAETWPNHRRGKCKLVLGLRHLFSFQIMISQMSISLTWLITGSDDKARFHKCKL